MYASLVVPFQITFGLAVVSFILMPLLGKKIFGLKKRISFLRSALIVVGLFIPSCIGIKKIVDPFRYGTFSYSTHEEIDNWRIRHWMPPAATDVVVHNNEMGHHAQFTVDKNALMEWLPQLCKEYAFCKEIIGPQVLETTDSVKNGNISYLFHDNVWKYPEDSVGYGVILRGDGAGFSIWYSESLNVAYLDAWYW